MAVILCPVGATWVGEIAWPASARSLSNCSGLAQVRETPSADADLLIAGTVAIDAGASTITITLDADDTLDMTEGGRGFMDLRLEWNDGEVQYPLADQWVEFEFAPTITREA